jgi:short-subunit dehydrogenase
VATTVLITGASMGLGAALAARYARDGARLGLIARDRFRLEQVAAECSRLGAAEVRCGVVDVCDRQAVAAWIRSFDQERSVDLAIACAGVLTGSSSDGHIEDVEESYRLYETNVLGVMNTVHPLVPLMVERQRGQIALLSSLAGLIPLPDMPSYSASKACVLSYGQSLRTLLRGYGIRVSVACPGFVDTPMTGQVIGAKPFLMSAADAAARIKRGLERDQSVIAFPILYAWLARFGGILPEGLRRFATRPFTIKVAPRNSAAFPAGRELGR